MTGTTAAEIVVTGLCKRFAPRETVLDGVQLTARSGGLSLVLGEPGSGKSTLARCLSGVYRPDAGDVTYRLGGRGEVTLTASDARTVAWLRTHHIASFDGHLAAAPRLSVGAAAARAARCSRSSAIAALRRNAGLYKRVSQVVMTGERDAAVLLEEVGAELAVLRGS